MLTDEEDLAIRGLRAAQAIAHATATNAGWYRDPATGKPVERNFGEVVALMHSEPFGGAGGAPQELGG